MREGSRRRFWQRRATEDDPYANFYDNLYGLNEPADPPTHERPPRARAGAGAAALASVASVAGLGARGRTFLLAAAGVLIVGAALMAGITVMPTGIGTDRSHPPGSASTSDEPDSGEGIADPRSTEPALRSGPAGKTAPGFGANGTPAARPATSSPPSTAGGGAPGGSTPTAGSSARTATTPPSTSEPPPTTPPQTPTPSPSQTCLVPNPLNPGICLIPK